MFKEIREDQIMGATVLFGPLCNLCLMLLSQVLLMTLQNAPPGLDYERDRRFSKVSVTLWK